MMTNDYAALAITEAFGPEALVEIRVQPNYEARQTNVSGDDFQTRILLCTAPVLMAILVDLEL